MRDKLFVLFAIKILLSSAISLNNFIVSDWGIFWYNLLLPTLIEGGLLFRTLRVLNSLKTLIKAAGNLLFPAALFLPQTGVVELFAYGIRTEQKDKVYN